MRFVKEKDDSQKNISGTGALSATKSSANTLLFITYGMMVASLIILTRLHIGIISLTRFKAIPSSLLFFANRIIISLTDTLNGWATTNSEGYAK